jgi:hypothetical protein
VRSALKVVLVILFLIFAGLQFLRPNFVNPPIIESNTLESDLNVPNEVNAILQRSCKDCHTNKTNYPWYANIQPIGWYLANHIKEGRRELNFSEWKNFSNQRKRRKLKEICEEVESREMPLRSYLLVHREAWLSDEDIRILCEWTKAEIAKIPEE